MLKLLKKWYFKIYHLLKFLGVFIVFFIASNKVNAECIDLLETPTPLWRKASSSNYRFSYSENESTNFYFQLTPNKKYTFWFDKSEDKVKFNEIIRPIFTEIRMNGQTTGGNWSTVHNTLIPSSASSWTITAASDFGGNPYVKFFLNIYSNQNITSYNSPFIDDIYHQPHLVEGETTCSFETPIPGPEESVYSTFLNLYTNKLQYLAEGFTRNPYLLAMIGIILGWIILELLLKILHLKGDYKK